MEIVNWKSATSRSGLSILLHVSSTSNITVCQPCVVVRSHTAVRSHITSQMFECPQVPANYNLNTCFCLSSSLGQKQLVEYRAWYILLQESLVPMCGRIKALVSTVYTCTQISVLNMQRVEGKCHLCNHTLNGATVHHQWQSTISDTQEDITSTALQLIPSQLPLA